jgi:hypothetical protein
MAVAFSGDISDAYRPAIRTIDSKACFISRRFATRATLVVKELRHKIHHNLGNWEDFEGL